MYKIPILSTSIEQLVRKLKLKLPSSPMVDFVVKTFKVDFSVDFEALLRCLKFDTCSNKVQRIFKQNKFKLIAREISVNCRQTSLGNYRSSRWTMLL